MNGLPLFQRFALSPRAALMLLWALSGFCVLALESVWIRALAPRAGNTVVASVAVIAVFFAAAALGNLAGARLAAGRARPLRLYGGFEAAAALCALAGFGVNRWLWTRGDVLPESAAGLAAAALLLVAPASFCSGASFPGLAEAVVEDAQHRTATGGRYYGLNLVGAAFGIALGGVLLPFAAGLTRTFCVAAVLQLAGAVLAWRLASSAALSLRPAGRGPRARGPDAARALPEAFGWCVLAASGVLSLAVQSLLLVWARQVLQGSVYAVCGVLTVFLGGLGAGGLAVAALRRRGYPAPALLAGFAGASAAWLFALPSVGQALCGREVLLSAATPAGLLAQTLAGCGWTLLPLTVSLGGVFPVAWELVGAQARSEGRAMGLALAVNKAGAACGAATGLLALLPAAGLVHGTLALGWGYLALAGLALVLARRGSGLRLCAWTLLAAAGLFLSLRPEPVLGVRADERVCAAAVGPYGPVVVVQNRASGSRQILLNSRQRLSGTRRALASQRHQSWIPLLFCRAPERVVTIGMAAGISAAAALDFPLKELHAIELVPEVAAAAREHFGEWNAGLFADPRAQVHVADGRVKLGRLPGAFDAIICDLFYPDDDGTAYLYSADFFAACRSRLAPGGVFCLWLPCYQLTPQTAGIVMRTFADAFPCAVAVRANVDPLQPVIGLLGAATPLPLSDEALAARLAAPEGRALAARSPFFRSADTVRLLFVADLHTAEPSFADHPATTDDRPVFAFLGPREPRGTERLFGFPLLGWIGTRALRPAYPSCSLGATSPQRVLAGLRAGNHLYAAKAAQLSLPGDRRSDAARVQQRETYLRQAVALWPAASAFADEGE